MMLLVSHACLMLQAYRGMQRDATEYTAQPHGINSMLLFAYLTLIISNAYKTSRDPVVAYALLQFCDGSGKKLDTSLICRVPFIPHVFGFL